MTWQHITKPLASVLAKAAAAYVAAEAEREAKRKELAERVLRK